MPSTFTTGRPLHLFGTVLAAQAGRTAGTTGTRVPGLTVVTDDLRGAPTRRANLIVVFVVDLSGSMTARKRLAAVSELCVDPLRDSHRAATGWPWSRPPVRTGQRAADTPVGWRCRLGTGARTFGGRTPWPRGCRRRRRVIDGAAPSRTGPSSAAGVPPTAGQRARPDALRRADAAAAGIARRGIASVVVDCEQGMIRPGMAHTLAARLGAQCLTLDELDPGRPAPDPGRTDRHAQGIPRELGNSCTQGSSENVPNDGLTTRQRRNTPCWLHRRRQRKVDGGLRDGGCGPGTRG